MFAALTDDVNAIFGSLQEPPPQPAEEGPQAESASTATKHDHGKLRYDLIPAEALEEIAKVFTHGAATYGDWNWAQGMDTDRFYAALFRHLMDWRQGRRTDPDSRLRQLAQVATNAIFLLCYELKEETDAAVAEMHSRAGFRAVVTATVPDGRGAASNGKENKLVF